MNKHTHEHNDGSYVVKKSKKSSIFAFIICFLIAFVIWAYTMSYGDGADVPEDNDTVTEETA
ncbi:MAG: hypothetical protein E7653_03210 [Ruminococcaceae bacterium]|nr:hypothetical protein [Oscillospiraceae bacterium]